MYRGSVAFFLLTALPLLAEEAAIDPYEDLPDYYPQHYRSLADVPERYHDGEKLTGCFMLDSVRQDYVGHGPWPDEEDIVCHNPFYLDEHGRIKNFRYGGDPSAKPPSGLPLGSELREDSLPAPCEGCLSEEQVLDVVRVYHRELGIEPLGYKASIVRGYPWNGRGSGRCEKYDRTSYLDSLHPDPRDPHPNERVNMRRVRRPMMGFNELCDASKDSQNRELTWRVRFQIGWHGPENRILNEHNLHKRDWPRTPCTVTNYIHAQTGKIRNKYHYHLQRYNHNPGERCRGATIENLHLLASTGRRAWNAYHQMHQRLFSYLPDSPSRDDRWLDYSEAKGYIESAERRRERKAKRKREAEEREGEVRGKQETHHLPPIDLRDTSDPSVLRDSTGDSGAQHIIVYWGEIPTTNLGHDDCFQEDDPDTDEDESELHDTKCKARVPRTRQCNDRNIPCSEPPADDTTTYDCMLWTRLHGDEQCHYRNRRGSSDAGWCARGDGRRYSGSGFASAEIHKHIAAVEALTEHQVGMNCDDPDFETQCDRLGSLFNISFSDNDTFAEINMFSLKAWKVRSRSSLAFYSHRYGRSEHDDPFTNSKKNDQYRRLSAPFDWRTRGEWCYEKPRRGRSCPVWDRRYYYVLVHEGAHDVTSSHLYDKFLWRTHPLMERLQWQTRGVGEGHALFIEEIAGRRRNRNDLGLGFMGSGSGDYLRPTTPNVDNRKASGALAHSDNYRATAEALLTAFRGVEDALETAVGNGLVSLDNGTRYATRRLFNNSLHSFAYLQDIFGRPNAHIDFCEARNEVHRRVRLLRTGVNHLTPFSISQPNISAAFDAMDIPACMQIWEASSTKECSEKTSGDPNAG